MRTIRDMIDIILLQPNIKDLKDKHYFPLWISGHCFSWLVSVLDIWKPKTVLNSDKNLTCLINSYNKSTLPKTAMKHRPEVYWNSVAGFLYYIKNKWTKRKRNSIFYV